MGGISASSDKLVGFGGNCGLWFKCLWNNFMNGKKNCVLIMSHCFIPRVRVRVRVGELLKLLALLNQSGPNFYA